MIKDCSLVLRRLFQHKVTLNIEKYAFSKTKIKFFGQVIDVHLETVISSDASSFGIGSVIEQRQPEGHNRPVAYASRSLICSRDEIRANRERSPCTDLGV